MKKTVTIKYFFSKIRHNLLIHVLINKLAKRGIIINPFYIVKVRKRYIDTPPKIRDNDPASYKVEIFNKNDLEALGGNNPWPWYWYTKAELQKYLDDNILVICVKHNELIVSSHMLNLNKGDFDLYPFELKSNEAYGFNLFTLESYKGKNLSAFQIYHTFDILEKFGKDVVYTINDYFNKSTIKVSKKNNAIPVKLVLYISLFKKLKWAKVLKTYPEKDTHVPPPGVD